MAINFDNALGKHPLALKLREQRTEVLAANMANADTPNFKARDLDFQAVLKGVEGSSVKLETTRENHLPPIENPFREQLKYRTAAQDSLDGNTVETEHEQMKFAENALQYQASLTFLSSNFAGLKSAIRGE